MFSAEFIMFHAEFIRFDENIHRRWGRPPLREVLLHPEELPTNPGRKLHFEYEYLHFKTEPIILNAEFTAESGTRASLPPAAAQQYPRHHR